MIQLHVFAVSETDQNPCLVNSKESTAPLSAKITKTFESMTPTGCINKIQEMDIYESKEACECFEPYYSGVKVANIIDEDEKYEETGHALMTKFQELSSDFAQLANLMPSLENDSDLFESCGIEKTFQFKTKTCDSGDEQVKKRLEKMFGSFMKDNKIIGIKGGNEFSTSNLVDKIKKEIILYTEPTSVPDLFGGSCVHPSFNFFIQKKEIDSYLSKENREQLYSSVVDNTSSKYKSAESMAFFRLLKMQSDGTVDKKGLELLKSEWNTIGTNHSSGDITTSVKLKQYLKKKLKASCEEINTGIQEAACSNKLSNLDTSHIKSNQFDHIANIIDGGKLSGDEDQLEKGLGSIKKICTKETKFENSVDSFWKSLTKNENLPSSTYSQNAKNSVKFSNNLSTSLGLCEELCAENGERDAQGFCKKKDIDKLLAKYGCSERTDKDDSIEKQKCDALTLLKEEKVIKDIEESLANYQTRDRAPGKYSSIAEEIRIRSSGPRKGGLLSRFLERTPDGNKKKEEKKVVKSESTPDKSPFEKVDTPKVGDNIKRNEDKAPNQQTQPQRMAQKKTNANQNKQKQIDMDAALNRLETAKGSLSFGRSSKGRGVKSSKSGGGSDELSQANSRLDSLMATLDNLQKDNSSIDNLIKNMNNQEAYGAGTGDGNGLDNSSYSGSRPSQLAQNGAVGSGGSFGSTPASAGALSSENPISNPSGGEYVGDIARTDLVGKSSTGVSSPEDGDLNTQMAPGVRKPASAGSGAKASSSDISKLFQGRLEASKVADNTNTSDLVQVEIKKGVKEVNLAELLKNRDEINPGEAFILYEVVQDKKIEVTLIPTFSNYKGKRFFAGYRPLDVNGSNRILVDKLKAEKNLLTQN